MSLYHRHHDLIDTPVGATRATTESRRFSPGQVVSGGLGALLTVMGIVAVTRAGIDSTLNQPVTDFLGITHSSYVGLFEIFCGLVLLLGATGPTYRGATGFAGALLIVGGVVVAAGNLRILLEVGAERATGWMAVVFGAVAIAAAMLPSVSRSSRVVERGPQQYESQQ